MPLFWNWSIDAAVMIIYHSFHTGFCTLYHFVRLQVKITREKVTWPGARIRKKGEGMPNYENNNLHGIMYITFDVEFPKNDFTDDEKNSECSTDELYDI